MRSSALLLGIMIPAALLLTSCTKRDNLTLAEFKDKKITVGDFEEAYKVVLPEYLPKAKGMDGKKEFLTTMLNRAVMEYKADELGYDKDPAVVQGMEQFRQMGLQAGYLKRKVADEVTVSEEEIKEHYRNKGATANIKQILVDTPAEAEEVMAELDKGTDFESVCKQYSKSPDASEGGKVMTISYGHYAPSVAKSVFRLKVGEYTQPIPTVYGFFIIKLLSRSDAAVKEDYDKNHDRLEQEVRVIKEALATNELTKKIREHYNVQWNWDGLQLCFQALPQDRGFDQAPSRRDEVYPLLYFDPEDLNKPVASYAGKEILIKDFSDFYDRASFYARPRRDFRVAGIKTFITERIMADLVEREMKRSNIENDPEIKKVMLAKKHEIMVSRLWDDMVNRQTTVTDKMVKNYYNENQDKFKTPEKRRFGVILTNDFDSAQKAYQELESGTLFRTVALAYSVDPDTKDSMGQTDLMAKGEQQEIDPVGFSLPEVGSVSKPFQTSRGWMILKVTEIEPPSTFTLDRARRSIEAAIKQQKNDERLQELLKKWKEELGVVTHDDNLAKVQIEERSPTETKSTSGQGKRT
jgi:peptidyl-prolyl cis-trans isomerase C